MITTPVMVGWGKSRESPTLLRESIEPVSARPVTRPHDDVSHPFHRYLQVIERSTVDPFRVTMWVGNVIVALNAEEFCV